MGPPQTIDLDDIQRPRFEEWLAGERSVDALLDTFARKSWRDPQIVGPAVYWRMTRDDLEALRRRIAREIGRRGGCVAERDVVWRAVGDDRFQCELPT